MKTRSQNNEPRAGIVDVAAAAGVGVGTASDALNGRGRMSEATRTRVTEVANMLAYRPRASARALRKGTTMALGLRFGGGVVPRGEFIIDLLNGAATAAHARGYGLLMSAPTLREAEIVDGLIVVDPINPKDAEVDGVRVITIGRARSRRHIPYIDLDFDAFIGLLMKSVEPYARQGAVWLLNEASPASFNADTASAFRRCCKRIGRTATVVECSDRVDSGVPAFERQLGRAELPAIVIAPTGGHAAMLQRHLQAHGVQIPEQVTIVCLCGDSTLTDLQPTIPACDPACWEQGQQVVDALLDWLNTGSPPKNLLMMPRLLVDGQ
jgi:DNA-binding LacI/PurR family transcriptional regulator